MRTAVCSASGRPELAAAWISEVETKTLEQLAVSGDFVTLYMKISAAVLSAAHGTLGQKMTLAEERASREGRIIKGR